MANVNNITSTNPGKNGVLFRAPLNTALPKDTMSELDPAFADLGIVGEDGLTQAITRDTEDKKSYGGDIAYTLQTDYSQELTATLYESANIDVLKTVFGDDNVQETSEGFKVLHNKKKLPRSVFVAEHLTDQGTKRQVIPIGQVVNLGDIQNTHQDIVMYEVTTKCFPDADGNVMYEYYSISTADGEVAQFGITTAVIAPATQGKAYTATLQASGGDGNYKFTAVGSLPAGLTLAENGKLSGTPTGSGEESFTVRVADGAGATAQRTLTLKINPTES